MKVRFDTNVTYLIMEIIKNYFLQPKLYSIAVLYDSPIEGYWQKEYLIGVENALQKFSFDFQIVLQWIRIDWSNGTNVNDSTNGNINLLHQHIDTGCEAFITITKHLDTFLTLKFKIQQYSTQRIRDRRFLFLSDQFVDMDIFRHPSFNIYPHHLLVVPSNKSNDSLDLLTQKFIGNDNRELPLLLDIFYLSNCTFMTNAVLYQDKLVNLEGRVVTVSAMEYIPYAFAQRKEPNENLYREWNSTGEKSIFFEGSEARIIINFCILRNCTLEFRISPDWGGVNIEAGTAEGQIGALYFGEADIAVASIGQWYFDLFESSSAIARSASTLVVPAPRPLSYFWTPILPFDLQTWLFFFSTLVLSIISFYLIKVSSEFLVFKKINFKETVFSRKEMKTSLRRTILEVLAVFLQQSLEVGSSKIAVRTVYGVLLLAAIVVENAYSGGLKSLLTVPKLVGRINTIHDYVETNYLWGAPHIAFAYAVRLSKVRDSMLMFKRVQVLSNDDLKNMSLSGKFGVAVERLHSGRITFEDYITLDTLEHLSILKDDLFFEYTMAITTRGWPLMEKFNKVALESLQHGLFVQWESEITDKYLDFTIERRLMELVAGYEDEPTPEILKIAHITGPLIMLCIGEVCALIAFIGEHLWLHFGKYYHTAK